MNNHSIIFLGTAAALQLPSFHCNCEICKLAREGKILSRTRSGLAITGSKNVLIDAGPDIAFQLERERIKKIDAIFITHWHYDHIGGLGEFGEPSEFEKWEKIQLYLPRESTTIFEKSVGYLESVFEVIPIDVGDKVIIDHINYQAVKTTHTPHSIGYIIEGKKKYAYLVDGIRPPDETMEALTDVDCLILEASADELDENNLMFLDIPGALDIWKEVGSKECILTHMSFHSVKNKQLIAGYKPEERNRIVTENPGLRIATDGLKVKL